MSERSERYAKIAAEAMPCGPYVCNFPDPGLYEWRERWTCPRCRTTYLRGRARRKVPWRNWSAPDGRWVLPFGHIAP